MPTARELLEQADALMRRNRPDHGDDIPVLTDAVPSIAEAPARARQLAGELLAPDGDVGEGGAIGSAHGLASGAHALASPPARVEPPAHEGEPSAWLDFEDPEPSVIGDAPDSVAIVPPVATSRAPDEELLQAAEHEVIELTTPVDDVVFEADVVAAEAAMAAMPVSPVPVVDEDIAALPESAAAIAEPAPMVAEWTTPVAPEVGASTTPAPAPTFGFAPAPTASALAAEFAGAAPFAPPAYPLAGPEADPGFSAAPQEIAAADMQGTVAAPVSAPRAGPDDQAHWDSLAEEIRMQVLQRIDLFTDTGLREQLAERLKPIVDRASADMVTTINQHIGELLRAYVAEAIEREIERWRQDN